MKKLLLFFVFMLSLSEGFSQTYENKEEFKNESYHQVLFVNGEKFTGPREDLWKIQKNLAPQPLSSDLVLLSTAGNTKTDTRKYFLYRFIDSQWEYIAVFQGETAPIITLTPAEFSAFQWEGDIRQYYTIRRMLVLTYPGYTKWVCRKKE